MKLQTGIITYILNSKNEIIVLNFKLEINSSCNSMCSNDGIESKASSFQVNSIIMCILQKCYIRWHAIAKGLGLLN